MSSETRRPSAAGFKILVPPVRGEEERLLYWNREIEASRAAEIRCFLAGYSLMGPQRASRLRGAEGSGSVPALLAIALVLCASQLLCLLLLHLLHLLHLLKLLKLLKLLLQGGCISSCSASLAFFFCGVLLVQVPLLFSSISLQNPVKQQQARQIYKAPAASPTSAAQRDQARFRSFRRSICIEKPRQPSGK